MTEFIFLCLDFKSVHSRMTSKPSYLQVCLERVRASSYRWLCCSLLTCSRAQKSCRHDNRHHGNCSSPQLPMWLLTAYCRGRLHKVKLFFFVEYEFLITFTILWNHFILWAWNFMVWHHWTCSWTLEFVDFKWYAILFK